jgi:hypothetical protein
MLNDAQFAELLKETEQAFNPFVATDDAMMP